MGSEGCKQPQIWLPGQVLIPTCLILWVRGHAKPSRRHCTLCCPHAALPLVPPQALGPSEKSLQAQQLQHSPSHLKSRPLTAGLASYLPQCQLWEAGVEGQQVNRP